MYNQAAGRLSEPGSTMKLATMLALMEDGVTNPDTLVHLNYGAMKFSDRTMHDSERHGRQYATMAESFELSSNVGVASLANDVYNSREGRKLWVKRLKRFGLDEPTGIDISGEAIPEIKDPVKNKDKWYGTTIPWMAHGYELALTPLQTLTFYNAQAACARLARELADDDFSANQTLDAHEAMLRAGLGHRFPVLAEAVRSFDFGLALSCLTEAAASLDIPI